MYIKHIIKILKINKEPKKDKNYIRRYKYNKEVILIEK